MKKTHSLTPRSCCHFCGRWDVTAPAVRRPPEHVVSLSAAKVDWCPESASRSAVRVRTRPGYRSGHDQD